MPKSLFRLAWLALCLPVSVSLKAQNSNAPQIEQHYQRGQQALRAKQNTVAAREFRAILRLDPHNASAHANLGMIAFAENDYASAAQEFRTALKLQPSLWNAEALLGMSELRMGQQSEARPLLEESFKHMPDGPLRSSVGTDLVGLYDQADEPDHAVDVLRVLARLQPEAPDVLYAAYRTYTDLAARSLARLGQAAPDSPQMHQVLAQALAGQDDFSGAIAQCRKALEKDPQLPGLHYELGQLILANSQSEPARHEAEKEFDLSLAADPADAYSEYMLGEIAWLRSNPKEALEHDLRAVKDRPDFVDAHIAAGKALTALGRPQEALPYLLEAVRLDARDEVAHYRLAQAYRKLGRNEEAGREEETFQKLRASQSPIRALYQQVQERALMVPQTVDPGERH